MIKSGTHWVQKVLTDTHDKTQPNGTLHSYDYFEDEGGYWVYNICFHHVDGPNIGFPSIQVKEPVFVPVEEVIEKAKEKFKTLKFAPQPAWSD